MLGILEELKKHKHSLWLITFTVPYVSVQFTWMFVHKEGYELRVRKTTSDRAWALIKQILKDLGIESDSLKKW